MLIPLALAGLALAGAPAARAAAAQEPEGPRAEDFTPFGEDPQRELRELFGRVERRLVRMDSLLLHAGAGDTSKLAEVGESGMQDLLEEGAPPPSPGSGVGGVLQHVRSQGEGVRRDMDRILELAEQYGSASAASQGGEPNAPEGQSPLDGRPPTQIERQSSPEGPSEEVPEDGTDGEPRSPEESRQDPDQRPGSRPPGSETEPPGPRSDDREQWGELPVHVRDIFRAEGGADLPTQYRDWIDSYYRRLNTRSGD